MIDPRIEQSLLPGNSFVELGCGTGKIVEQAAHSYRVCFGLDSIAPANIPTNWKFICADLNKRFPLEENFADCVIANQVIEHLVSPVHFAREVRRILKPGGRVIVTTPNIRYIKNIWAIASSGHGPRTAGANEHGDWDGGHFHYFTHRDLIEIFRAEGFGAVNSYALIDISSGNLVRRVMDRLRGFWLVREILSGNIVLTADKQ